MTVEWLPWFGALTPGLSQAALSTVIKEVPQSPPGRVCILQSPTTASLCIQGPCRDNQSQAEAAMGLLPTEVPRNLSGNILGTLTLRLIYISIVLVLPGAMFSPSPCPDALL